MEKEINPYKEQDVENAQMPENDGTRFGSTSYTDAKEIQIGAGNSVFRGDKSGIWLGAEKIDNAPFRVDMFGNCFASSIILSGYTTSSDVTTIIGDTVTTGYINALNITAGSVDAADITGTTMTGKTVRTASSGQRVQMSGSTNDLRVYDSTGELRMSLNQEILQFYDETGSTSGIIYASSGTYETLYITNSGTDGAIILDIDNTGYFAIGDDANARLWYLPSSNYWVIEHDLISSENGLYNLGASAKRFDTVYCVALDESSDIRLKENIVPSKYGLEDILKMEPIMYNFKEDTNIIEDKPDFSEDIKVSYNKRIEKQLEDMSEDKKTKFLNRQAKRDQDVVKDKSKRRLKKSKKIHIGFSAQDMYNIIPEVTNNANPDSEETASINKTQLIPVLVKAIQELNEKVNSLVKEINTLKKTPKNL